MNKDQFRIDYKSKLPLYDQIERNLQNLIVDGHLKPSEAMPGKWDLAEMKHDVSRFGR